MKRMLIEEILLLLSDVVAVVVVVCCHCGCRCHHCELLSVVICFLFLKEI